jgi:hypothetical protein
MLNEFCGIKIIADEILRFIFFMHLLPDRELFLKSTKVTKILIGE